LVLKTSDTKIKKIVDILKRLSGSSQLRKTSLWPFILFTLFGALLFAYQAAIQVDLAGRQKMSFGKIRLCEMRGRGHDNYCSYTFSVDDAQYTAVSKAERAFGFGQIVTVYYDSQDPRSSALEDFSQQSRQNLHLAFILGVLLVAAVGFFLWDRAR
jgi:hypothetical protein